MASKLTNAIVIDMSTQRVKAIKKYITNSKTQIPVAGGDTEDRRRVGRLPEQHRYEGPRHDPRAELKAAQKARDEAELTRVSADDALKGYVVNVFGADSTEAHRVRLRAEEGGGEVGGDQAASHRPEQGHA